MAENKKENKVKKHIVEVETKEIIENNDNELNDRINRLYGVSSPSKEEKQYDPKELQEIRKKLMLLLAVLIIFVIIAFIVLIKPFDFNNKDSNNDSVQEEEKENNNENNQIDINSDTIVELNNLIEFSVNDFKEIDLFSLYSDNVLESNNIPNNIKLYMLKRTNVFEDLLDNNGIVEYLDTCSQEGLIIKKEDFDKVVTSVFGPNTTVQYDKINYMYYRDSSIAKKVTLSYENDNYILRCNEFTNNTVLTKYIQYNLKDVVSSNDSIELYQNVVFINQSGVYKDSNFNELITNDQNAQLNDYISKGVIYKYTFVKNEDNYYLSKIEKINETN